MLTALQAIGAQGRADFEPIDGILRGYYPVPEHLRALDPEVVLIVGPRGAGKTEIARVLTEAGLAGAVASHAPSVRFPKGQTDWKKGYPLGSEGFDVMGLPRFLKEPGISDPVAELRNLWFAYLVRVLRDELDAQAKSNLAQFLSIQGGAVRDNYKAFLDAGEEPVLGLDRLDEELSRQDRFIFVTYDELDTLGGGDWNVIGPSIQGLVAFWAAYARRWRRIRAKVFLRTDLYDRHTATGGADLAKLAAGRVDLSWSDRDLHAMLLKRIANASPELYKFVSATNSKVEWSEDTKLGHVPALNSWRDASPIIERMIGPYMGADKKKGLVYRWLLDHVRDGRGRALPRPLVQLIEEAARIELRGLHPLREPRLLDPSSLRRALDRVSEDHVVHARDEWPWLDSLKEGLKGLLVPWERERDAIRLLEGTAWAENPPKRPPFEGRELLEYLIEVGILRRRSDNRIDAPDLFLAGMGLRRKGGVRRR
jgi:hypothetical protein